LTILISDMGDTVVKAIKDLTIWFGEITVLPSEEEGLTDRLKHGIYKASLGKVDPRTQGARDVEQNADTNTDDDDDSGYQELHPGLARLFRRPGRGRSGPRNRERTKQMAAGLEESEKQDEERARGQGNRLEEGKRP
jgi:hypothetical protein